MKPFIINSLFFLFIFLFIFPLLLMGWGYTGGKILVSDVAPSSELYGYTRSRLLEAQQTSHIDVLILGSSHAYNGFDTRIFAKSGLKTFNLGSSGQTHLQTKMLLQRYLDQLEPKLVIYEVYPLIFTLDGLESGLELVLADKNDKYSWEMVRSVNHLKLYNTYLFSIMQECLNIKDTSEEPVDIYTYIPGGFVEAKMSFFEPIEFAPTSFEFNKKQFEAFEDILTMFEKRGIEYILVTAPVTRAYYQSMIYMPQFDHLMQTYGRYYNFNDLLQLEDTVHFRDQDHLNQQGVEIFNRAFISAILEKDQRLGSSVPY